MPDGGEASLYVRGASQRAALVPEMKACFENLPGIAAAYTKPGAKKFGLPASGVQRSGTGPLSSRETRICLWDGSTDGPLEQEVAASGAHGYLNADPDMEALFIASGAHIRSGVDLGVISNLRVAPTIAKILGVSLPAATQAPLINALQ